LTVAWSGLQQHIIDEAIDQRHGRLCAVYDVTIEYLYGDIIFDAVLTILYVVKIVPSFHMVQYKHKNTKVVTDIKG